MEGTVERIEATTTKNGKNKWRVWVGGDEHTDWDRPNYAEGQQIRYTLSEKPKDGGGTWKTIRDAMPVKGAATPPPKPATTAALGYDPKLLDLSYHMAHDEIKFSDIYANYLALKDMVTGKEEEEPEPGEPEEQEPPI